MPYTKVFLKLIVVASSTLVACGLLAQSGSPTVTVRVEVVGAKNVSKSAPPRDPGDASNIVVWLVPLEPSSIPGSTAMPRMTQINKSFEPHILVIEVGTPVQFPNRDPFLHNVFSLFDGKRFDLGFYEAGSSKTVHFDRPGVSYLFCNIHPEMSGAVVAVDTPYFGMSDRGGRVSIAGVPDGRYQLNVWYERSLPEDLKSAGRVVTISESNRTLDPIRVSENPNFSLDHKNKYGQDYVPPASSSPVYHP